MAVFTTPAGDYNIHVRPTGDDTKVILHLTGHCGMDYQEAFPDPLPADFARTLGRALLTIADIVDPPLPEEVRQARRLLQSHGFTVQKKED